MKKTIAISMLTLMTVSILMYSALSVRSAEPEKKLTLKGEIVDLACYIGHGAKGEKHKQCALTCLKDGQPMGLLTADGTVYLLFADHQNKVPYDEAKTYAALNVEITGPSYFGSGIKAVTVESVKKLQ